MSQSVKIVTSPAEVPAGSPGRLVATDRGWRIFCGAILLVGLVCSRLPLAPRHLITFDEINFALSIRQFNPAVHQPQPPGYPLFVGLLKLVSAVVPKVETVFLVAALTMSVASLALLWILGEQMLPRRWGMLPAFLLLWNPPFWYSALTNPVRLGLSTGSTGVALCLFLALRRRSPAWFIAAGGALGIAAGFRPTLLVVMAPLWLWTAFSLRPSRKALAGSLASLALGIFCWLPFLTTAAGGVLPFYRLLIGYAHDQTQSTSALTGAPMTAALHMALEAIVWSCLGALSWIWAVPSAARRNPALLQNQVANRFLLFWFVPAFALSAILHVGDPDQTLAIIPVTCLVGAYVLSSFKLASIRARALLLTSAVALNVFLFFKPITKIAKASTYTTVAWLDGYVGALIDGASHLDHRFPQPLVVFPPGIVGWRNVSYYVPAVRLLVAGEATGGFATVFRIQNGRVEAFRAPSESIPIPSCGRIALAGTTVPAWDRPEAPVGSSQGRYFFLFPSSAHFAFRSQGVRFAADDTPCAPGR